MYHRFKISGILINKFQLSQDRPNHICFHMDIIFSATGPDAYSPHEGSLYIQLMGGGRG